MEKIQRKSVQNIWLLLILVIAVFLTIISFGKDISSPEGVSVSGAIFIWLIIISFFAEYVDTALGMGYGAVVTPLLLIIGFSPLQILPAILIAEIATGIAGGLLHAKAGNVDFHRHTQARAVVKIIIICSIAGSLLAMMIVDKIDGDYVTYYIGILHVLIGLLILTGWKILGIYTQNKIKLIGLIASFSKGISGSGFGSLVTGGQVMLAVPVRSAVGITSLTEGFVCVISLALFFILQGIPSFSLALPLFIGGMLSIPLSVLTVKVLPRKLLQNSIGWTMLFLGLLTLLKIIIG